MFILITNINKANKVMPNLVHGYFNKRYEYRCFDSDCLHEQSEEFVSLSGEYQEIHDGVIRDIGCGLSLQQGELGEGEEGFPLGDIHRE